MVLTYPNVKQTGLLQSIYQKRLCLQLSHWINLAGGHSTLPVTALFCSHHHALPASKSPHPSALTLSHGCSSV